MKNVIVNLLIGIPLIFAFAALAYCLGYAIVWLFGGGFQIGIDLMIHNPLPTLFWILAIMFTIGVILKD